MLVRNSLLRIATPLLALLMAMSGQWAFAQSKTDTQISAQSLTEDYLDQQRQLYSEALELMRKGRWKSLAKHRQQLTTYPLYPYLIYADLIVNLRYSRHREIAAYLSDYQGTVKAQHLRNKWLDYLAGRNYWTTFIEFFNPAQASIKHQCQFEFARASRLEGVDRERAIESGLRLWNVGKSQPKECDKLFSLLVSEKKITQALAWQRYNKALLKNQSILARYLQRFLKSNQYKTLAKRYYDADRNPQLIGNFEDFSDHTPEELDIITSGLVRLAKADSHSTLRYWSHYQQTHEFSHQARSDVVSAIIKGLYQQQFSTIADAYFEDHLQLLNQTTSGSLTEWRIRKALQERDWLAVQLWIKRLPKAKREQSAWRYWAIRSMEAEASTTLDPRLPEMTASLARERDFYGFLASEKLDREYSLNHQPLAIDEVRINRIKRQPAMLRARELFFHRDIVDANREWNQATEDFVYEDWLAAAIIASQWQWHNKAIASLGQAKYWDDIEIRFPLAYTDIIDSTADRTAIANYLLMALARQESAFNPLATSSAGAMGLMQLMPATAKGTARKHKLSYRKKSQLHQPSINVPIAGQYYRNMLDRYDNNRILASAAYNAGPRRVDQWLNKTDGELPFDIWIELIPFNETRSYVRNILMYSIIYSRKLGLTPAMLDDDEKLKLL
ncbi:MAG: transglycosylase SLT domain-containing protein [Porticoccaceae bacterium]|nr:transglycosylase SLT domain-containing protein [Porticoccaceae bacterium]